MHTCVGKFPNGTGNVRGKSSIYVIKLKTLWKKPPPTSFSPVTSTNVGFGP